MKTLQLALCLLYFVLSDGFISPSRARATLITPSFWAGKKLCMMDGSENTISELSKSLKFLRSYDAECK